MGPGRGGLICAAVILVPFRPPQLVAPLSSIAKSQRRMVFPVRQGHQEALGEGHQEALDDLDVATAKR